MPTQPLILPIAPYAPDLPDYPAPGSAVVRNVYPRTDVSYGPISAPAAVSDALDARCQGSASFFNSTGDVFQFAGDATDLYALETAKIWGKVSRSGGYSTPSDVQWEFEYFNGQVITTNYADPIQSFALDGGSTFGQLASGAPRAKHIAVVKNSFVVVGNTYDGTDGIREQRLWWCAAGDATNWPTPGSTEAAELQAGSADLLGNVGAIQAIRSGISAADALVFQSYAVKKMMYSGPPDIFDFLPAENLKGTPAPYSPVALGGIVYYLSYDGWYATDGSDSKAIGANRIDKTFWNDVDRRHLTRIAGAVDPINKLVWWIYPSTQHDEFVNCDRALIYNWELDRWSLAEINTEMLSRMLTIGYTLDELHTILGYTIDGLPAPLDSPVWQGGQLILGSFDTSHKLSYLTGAPLAAQVDTSEMQPFPGRRALVRGARPIVDGGTPSVVIGHRERVQDQIVNTQAVALNSIGACPVRTSGRYFRGSILVPAGTFWSNISGIELDAAPQGIR